MASAMMLVVAVGLTSAVCYALMIRADRQRMQRRSKDTSGSDAGGSADGGGGSGSAHWFGHDATDSMGNPIDGGGSDGGPGGDGGGGDGGGD